MFKLLLLAVCIFLAHVLLWVGGIALCVWVVVQVLRAAGVLH